MSPVQQDIHYTGGGMSTVWIGQDINDDIDIESYMGLNNSPGTMKFTYPDPRLIGIYPDPPSQPDSISQCSQEL
jgi:hypothetical protein